MYFLYIFFFGIYTVLYDLRECSFVNYSTARLGVGNFIKGVIIINVYPLIGGINIFIPFERGSYFFV